MVEISAASSFQTIPVDQISPSPHQARKVFEQEALQALAESMKQEGLLQHNSKIGTIGIQPDFTQIVAINVDGPMRWLVKGRHQSDDG